MNLSLKGIRERSAWEKAGIRLPNYDPSEISIKTKSCPVWIHMGIGNIFRMFIARVADTLIENKELEGGIICISPYDHEIVDRVYRPHDNLVLAVTFEPDGSLRKEVIGSIAQAFAANRENASSVTELKHLAEDQNLQLISFTITEKGYALYNKEGEYLAPILRDIENGPELAESAMGIVSMFLYHRFCHGRYPLALVSMDNCSNNGDKLKNAVVTIANEWVKLGFCSPDFIAYLTNKKTVSFPWTMIDKITPRPAEEVALALKQDGIEGIERFVTAKNTYAAPFVNGECAEYLVVEDSFPNGRPRFEKAGVLMCSRDMVQRAERMKVTACLNPLHTALAVYGCLLGYERISDEMKDPELLKLIRLIGEKESLPVLDGPNILSAEEFLKEVVTNRLPNPMLPDTPQRIACDTSQKVGVRYGETIKAYIRQYGSASKLTGIPAAIAGWCRYLLGVDDEGVSFDLSSDPMLEELTKELKDIKVGNPKTYIGQLRPILSNSAIFGTDLYVAGIGEKIESIFLKEITGKGAVRATLMDLLD